VSVRVAFLGDSHVACVALAARSMNPGLCRPTFFADVVRQLDALQIEGGRLRAGSEALGRVLRCTSGCFDVIDPKQYDLFVLMGLEFEFPFDCIGQQFYSRAVTEQTIRDHLSRSLAFSTLEKLRQVTRLPVWLMHTPLRDPARFILRPGVLTYAEFLDLAAKVFRPLNASVLSQPEETLVDDHFSLPEFSRSPVRLANNDGSPVIVGPDGCHKNEAFGKAIFRDIEARLETFRADVAIGPADEPPTDAEPDAWRPRKIGTVHERRNDQVIVRLSGGGGVHLNRTAGLIWEYCDGSRTEAEILAGLCGLFGTAADTLQSDFREALDRLVVAGALEPRPVSVRPKPGPAAGPFPAVHDALRLRVGLVSETSADFLNQVKLCLFCLRRNGGVWSRAPVTLMTNGEPLSARETRFLAEHFAPIDFRTAPKLGAIPHTSKLNVFYSIDPSEYDVLLFMDCDTVVRRPLDRITDPIVLGGAQFTCRRGGTTDRNMFVDFNALVNRFCIHGRKDKILYDGTEEWPMFNSGVFLATPEAVGRVRKSAIEFSYRLFNEWQRANALERLPEEIRTQLSIHQVVRQNWTIEQGALALACIDAGVNVQYLDGTYNSWGGEADFHVLHCFKSLYQFDRRSMFSADAEQWIAEYAASEIPGKAFLASMVREYKQSIHEINAR